MKGEFVQNLKINSPPVTEGPTVRQNNGSLSGEHVRLSCILAIEAGSRERLSRSVHLCAH